MSTAPAAPTEPSLGVLPRCLNHPSSRLGEARPLLAPLPGGWPAAGPGAAAAAPAPAPPRPSALGGVRAAAPLAAEVRDLDGWVFRVDSTLPRMSAARCMHAALRSSSAAALDMPLEGVAGWLWGPAGAGAPAGQAADAAGSSERLRPCLLANGLSASSRCMGLLLPDLAGCGLPAPGGGGTLAGNINARGWRGAAPANITGHADAPPSSARCYPCS